MTNFTTRMMFAAATLVVAAGSASAQALKAEIPFMFRANGVVMAAGKYTVLTDTRGGRPIYQLRSESGHRSILLASRASSDPKKEWVAVGQPVLSFECGASHCALATIWAADGTPAYAVPRPKLGRDEPTSTALVVMRHDKGD